MNRALAKVGAMEGLSQVKTELNGIVDEAIVEQQRIAEGYEPQETTHHLVFLGDPGTGKTSVADAIGPMYHGLGILPKDTVIHAKASDMIGSYAGETQNKTQALLNRAHGGVLFIDEAYQLGTTEHGNMYGRDALNVLVHDMDAHRGDTVVILAGYPHQIETLIKVNPGLESRLSNYLHFERYTPAESVRIGRGFLKPGKYTVTGKAGRAYDAAIKANTSGNAREVRNLFERVRSAQRSRLAAKYGENIPSAEHPVITAEDVAAGVARYQTSRLRQPKPRAAVAAKKPVPAGR